MVPEHPEDDGPAALSIGIPRLVDLRLWTVDGLLKINPYFGGLLKMD